MNGFLRSTCGGKSINDGVEKFCTYSVLRHRSQYSNKQNESSKMFNTLSSPNQPSKVVVAVGASGLALALT